MGPHLALSSRPVAGGQVSLSQRPSEQGAAQREASVIELVGAPKTGLRLTIDSTPTRLTLVSRLDPALLYLVLGAAILLGIVGAVWAAPDRSVLQAGLFAALCSPIALFLMISALRLRFVCVVDRARNELRIRERGYLTVWQRRYALENVERVYLLSVDGPEAPFGGRHYLLSIAVPHGAYLLAEGARLPPLEAMGRELARYLGVPLDQQGHALVDTGSRRRLLIGILLYAAPVSIAVTVLGMYLPESPSAWALPTTLTAIVLSQVGAILALLYYRQRGGDAAGSPRLGAADADSSSPLAGPDSGP